MSPVFPHVVHTLAVFFRIIACSSCTISATAFLRAFPFNSCSTSVISTWDVNLMCTLSVFVISLKRNYAINSCRRRSQQPAKSVWDGFASRKGSFEQRRRRCIESYCLSREFMTHAVLRSSCYAQPVNPTCHRPRMVRTWCYMTVMSIAAGRNTTEMLLLLM